MRIATWNLNNRVGKTRFRPEAACAAIALGADILVFTEFFPQQNESLFRTTLENAGWRDQIMSAQTSEVANRVLVASRRPLAPLLFNLPTFDEQFPANIIGVSVSCLRLSILGVRVPAYRSSDVYLLSHAWEWLETITTTLKTSPAMVVGDFNVSLSKHSRQRDYLHRILARGWQRAAPNAATFFSHSGNKTEIDHVLATSHCVLSDAECVQERGGFIFAGGPDAISDHAALVCRVEVSRTSEIEAGI